MHKIIVISAGPGGSDHITDAARNKAAECEVLIGSEEQLITAGTQEGQIVHEEWGIENIMGLIERYEGKVIGVLVTGDAGIYSLAQRFSDRFGSDSMLEIIPGVSSVQVAFARIKEPWLNVKLFSFRREPMEGLDRILRHDRIAILCDKEHDAKTVLGALEKAGLFNKQRKVFVCQELTRKEEKITKISSREDIENIEVKYSEIIVIIRDDDE